MKEHPQILDEVENKVRAHFGLAPSTETSGETPVPEGEDSTLFPLMDQDEQ